MPKKQIELYTGEYVEIGGVRVKCEKSIQQRPGGGPPRFGVVLVCDEPERKEAEATEDTETSEDEAETETEE